MRRNDMLQIKQNLFGFAAALSVSGLMFAATLV